MKKLTVRGFVVMGDKTVPIESLTPEELENLRNKWAERLSKGLSEYYSQHLDEFERLNCRSRKAAVQ